jgi:hypothetical protein
LRYDTWPLREPESVQHRKAVEMVIEQVVAGLEFPRAVAHQTSFQPVRKAAFRRKALQDDLGIQRAKASCVWRRVVSRQLADPVRHFSLH